MNERTDLGDKERITILVCCYNAQDTLGQTLETLRAQSHGALEILVIDDGSTDQSAEILRELAGRDARMRVLSNPVNRGTAFTRQRGLEEARTDLVIFFDADDLAEPHLVERLYRHLVSDPDLMGVSCHFEYFDMNNMLGVQRAGALDKKTFMESYRNNKLYFQTVATLFRRDLALRVGGFRLDVMPNVEGVRFEDFAEDLDLWCRMSDLGAEGRYFVTLPELLFRYRKHMGSLSTRNLRLMQLKMRWIKDCLRRRRAGTAERSLAAFITSRSWHERLADFRSDKAAEFYKKAGFAYSRRDYPKLAFYLGLTGMTSPKLIRQKLRTQSVRR